MNFRFFQMYQQDTDEFRPASNLDQVRTERFRGCDGKDHAVETVEVFYDRFTQRVVHADQSSIVITGPCDGSCYGQGELGFFGIPV